MHASGKGVAYMRLQYALCAKPSTAVLLQSELAGRTYATILILGCGMHRLAATVNVTLSVHIHRASSTSCI